MTPEQQAQINSLRIQGSIWSQDMPPHKVEAEARRNGWAEAAIQAVKDGR